ncbi:MAG: LacI family DNA-binding transcriptional regulator [Pseudomonadota bacterium]
MESSRPKQQRVTIKDIAAAADVDPSTVTRALQGSDRVKAATRQRISALATQMGYVPNMAARTLVTQRSQLLGLVVPDMTNPFFADLARGVEEESASQRLRILIRNTDGDEVAEREAIRFFLELKVDGMLVPMARSSDAFYKTLSDEIPLIHINRVDARHHVSCDMAYGTRAVVDHLIELGHRRIGFVTGPASPAQRPKRHGYEAALRGAGIAIDDDLVLHFDGSLACVEALADAVLRVAPTAVFAWNDVCAMGLIRALRDRGIAVPADVSVAGHDDIALAACYDPPLTTVHWPMYELGQQAVRYLFRVNAGEANYDPAIPPPTLVVRGSTSEPPR